MTQPELEQLVLQLKGRLDAFERSDRFVFSKTMQHLDGRNIQLGSTTGTKIGTASTQKLGFFNATPVVRPGAISSPGAGGADSDGVARTAIASIISTLHNLGLTA